MDQNEVDKFVTDHANRLYMGGIDQPLCPSQCESDAWAILNIYAKELHYHFGIEYLASSKPWQVSFGNGPKHGYAVRSAEKFHWATCVAICAFFGTTVEIDDEEADNGNTNKAGNVQGADDLATAPDGHSEGGGRPGEHQGDLPGSPEAG